MAQAISERSVPDTSAQLLQQRIDQLEKVMRTVLEQIDTHQIYDKDARMLIRRALVSGIDAAAPAVKTVRSASEFPSMFPFASARSNFA